MGLLPWLYCSRAGEGKRSGEIGAGIQIEPNDFHASDKSGMGRKSKKHLFMLTR